MSSRKDEKREGAVTKPENGSDSSRHLEDLQRQQQEAIARSFDATIENVRKTLNEAEQEIPIYTQVIKDTRLRLSILPEILQRVT